MFEFTLPSLFPSAVLSFLLLPPLSGSDETGKPDAGPHTHILHGRRGRGLHSPCRVGRRWPPFDGNSEGERGR